MSPENPVSLRVLLGFLKAGRVLDGGSSVLLLGTILLIGPPQAWPGVLSIGIALAVGLIEKYLAWRVALDVEFFTLLREQPEQAGAFDQALAVFLSNEPPTALRSMASRWQGARQLVKRQALVVGLQALVLLAVAAGAVIWKA